MNRIFYNYFRLAASPVAAGPVTDERNAEAAPAVLLAVVLVATCREGLPVTGGRDAVMAGSLGVLEVDDDKVDGADVRVATGGGERCTIDDDEEGDGAVAMVDARPTMPPVSPESDLRPTPDDDDDADPDDVMDGNWRVDTAADTVPTTDEVELRMADPSSDGRADEPSSAFIPVSALPPLMVRLTVPASGPPLPNSPDPPYASEADRRVGPERGSRLTWPDRRLKLI